VLLVALRAWGVALLALGWLGCEAALLATPSGEAKLGSAAAKEVEQHVGLVRSPELERYVAAIGERLTKSSAVRSDIAYRFSVVDLPEPNAFALPGGYIYVSRGLLALLNSEDELASVIAHEIGHVSARHHLRHSLLAAPLIPVRLATGIGSLATGIVSPSLGHVVGALGNAPGSIALATHSRGQEDEADVIGQQLVAGAGWDPRAIAAVMDALTREDELGGRDPNQTSFLDTHPTTPDRAKRTLERAATLKQVRIAPIAPDRRHFLAMLDGLLCGDAASEGVLVDNEFLHPDLDLRIAFPDGWKVGNGRDSVISVPEPGDALAIFSIAAKDGDPVAVASQVIRSDSLQIDGDVESTKIGGRPAARVLAVSRAGWRTHYRHLVGWVRHGGFVFQISGTTLEKDWPHYREAIVKLVGSFRPLTPHDRERVREAHLRVIDAKEGEHLADLLKRVDSAWLPERAAASNGLASVQAVLHAGQPVKVARWEVYAAQ
jgi:predicted Zn-dependent protease